MSKIKENILVIDGSFIGHRSVYSLGKRLNKDVTLDTQEEMMLFEQQYKSDIISIAKSFNSNITISGVVLFIDNKSWRHSVEPFKPYYINAESKEEHQILSYKGNRKKNKEASSLDYDNLNYCMANAGSQLSNVDGFITSSLKGFEADDGIYLTAHNLSEIYNVLIFANDGDIGQSVINSNVFYFNNSKSKAKPKRCIYVSPDLRLNIPVQPMELMKYKNRPEVGVLRQISKIEIGNDLAGTVNRSFEDGSLEIVTPNFYGLTKSIIGDKKDNIKPIIAWFSATGRMGRVLPKNIDAAIVGMKTTVEFDDDLNSKYGELFKNSNIELISSLIIDDVTNNTTAKNLNELTKIFLINLINSTGQKGIAKNVFGHLKHNIKMMMLSIGSVETLNDTFNSEIKPKIIETTKQQIVLDNSNLVNQKIDIIHSSIPDENIKKSDGDVVDDILDNL